MHAHIIPSLSSLISVWYSCPMARHPAATVLAQLAAAPRRQGAAAEWKAASQHALPRRACSTATAADIPSARFTQIRLHNRPRTSNRQQTRLLHALQRTGSGRIPNSRTTITTTSKASHFSTSTSHREDSSPSSSTSSSLPPGPKALYHQKVKQGLLQEDPRQLIILEDLQAAYDGIVNYKPPPVPEPLEDITTDQSSSSSSSPGFFARLFGRSSSSSPPIPIIPEDVPKSLYLFGDVGCGKSMLMDLVRPFPPTRFD